MIGATPYDAAGYHVLKLETHLHTLHSDGQHSIRDMFEACRAAGYQAVALTDHNTQSGIAEARGVAAELGLVFVPGVEVTTFRGHAVVLGVSCVPEWRDLVPTTVDGAAGGLLARRGLDALAAEVHAAGGLVCVAHPAALGSPVCSGCAWEWPLSPASVDLWEVFSASRPNAEVPLALWRQVLTAGGGAAPVAAGDVHSIAAAARPKIATHVYARQRSADGVLEALRARRLFASAGERLDFWLERENGEVVLGGGRACGERWTPRVGEPGEVREFEVGSGRCLYAEMRDAQGTLVGTSAPIWIDTSH
jgi:hypothetical protein